LIIENIVHSGERLEQIGKYKYMEGGGKYSPEVEEKFGE
jgi:hypothetical protein